MKVVATEHFKDVYEQRMTIFYLLFLSEDFTIFAYVQL